MDPFLDNSQLIGLKRKFEDQLAYQDTDVSNTSIRHNLLRDFEEADSSFKAARLSEKSLGHSHSSSFKQIHRDSSNWRRQLTLKDAEIASLKASVIKMETRIAAIQRDAQEALIAHEKEMTECKMAKEHEMKKMEDLKSKLQYVMTREKNTREEVQRLEKDRQRETLEFNKRLLAEEKLKLECKDKAQQAKLEWFDKEAKMNEMLMKQKHKIDEIQSKLEESLEAQSALRNNLPSSSEQSKIEQLEEAIQQEKKKVQELESRFAEQEDNIVVTKALKADLDMVPSMKAELQKVRQDNQRLRSNEQNTLLLEEEIRGLKKKLEQLESLQDKKLELETENEDLKGRLFRWEASDTSGSRRPQSPSSLSRRVHELETANANLLIYQGEMQTKVNLSERKLKEVETENIRLSASVTSEKNTVSQLNDMVKRLKRKMLLQSKERDVYKGLLDSYESEVTINFDAEKTSQIQKLEALLQECQQVITESEAKTESLSNQLADTLTKLDQAHQQVQILNHPGDQSSQEDRETIKHLREQNAIIESELIKTQEERNILEARIEQRQLQGDYDPTKTKIIHLLENPHAKAQRARREELQKLQEDNEKLKKRNKILEEHGGEVEDITMQVEEKLQQGSPSKEVEELKSQLASSEMRNQRLKEIFSKTSKEFREVCYQLTGYRFDLQCANQYKLTSMYAERQKDYLLFQQNSQGEVQLLQTDFSMEFQNTMENDLQKLKSFPLFLSHITLELFSRQTMSL